MNQYESTEPLAEFNNKNTFNLEASDHQSATVRAILCERGISLFNCLYLLTFFQSTISPSPAAGAWGIGYSITDTRHFRPTVPGAGGGGLSHKAIRCVMDRETPCEHNEVCYYQRYLGCNFWIRGGQGRIQNFSFEEAPIPRGMCLPNILVIFSAKPYEIKEILVRNGGVCRVHPPKCATGGV